MSNTSFEYDLGCAKIKYKSSKKQKYFEYFVLKIVDYWKIQNPNKQFEDNDLGWLKINLLLFFTTSVSSNSENDALFSIFDKWEAQPYGHVEKDIQELNRYLKGDFVHFKITSTKLILK